MDGAAKTIDGRSMRHANNPETQAYSVPFSDAVCLQLDLGSGRIEAEYDRLHAEALHRELGVAIELIGVTPRPSYRERMGK